MTECISNSAGATQVQNWGYFESLKDKNLMEFKSVTEKLQPEVYLIHTNRYSQKARCLIK